jgi:hypothetical protein
LIEFQSGTKRKSCSYSVERIGWWFIVDTIDAAAKTGAVLQRWLPVHLLELHDQPEEATPTETFLAFDQSSVLCPAYLYQPIEVTSGIVRQGSRQIDL